MKKIKVCHFVSGLKAGGVESMIYNYCKHLDSNIFDFYIIYQHEPAIKNVNEFKKINFKLIRISSKVKHPIKNIIETYDFLKKNEIDVIHCHMTLMNVIPLVIAKKLNIKVRICHSHNNDLRKKFFILKFIECIIKKICIKTSTDLVACGMDAGKYMFNNLPFKILNNALEIDEFKFNIKNREFIRSKFNIEKNQILIGHIGRFTNQKNHSFIIDCFKEILNSNNNYKLMLIGDGELKQEIQNKVKKNKIEDKVIFCGIVDNINMYYSAFDIFILPSLWEGLPVSGLEAQISGLKCLFSENIDKKVKIINTLEFLKIEDKKCWIDNIKNIDNNYSRKFNCNKLKKIGYDIETEYKKLENIYLGKKGL